MDISMLLIELVGFIAFLYITLRLLAVYRKLNTPEIVLSSASFLFLSVSQLCAALSTICSSIKVSICSNCYNIYSSVLYNGHPEIQR